MWARCNDLIFEARSLVPALGIAAVSSAGLQAAPLTFSADAHSEGNARVSKFETDNLLSIANANVGGNKAYLMFDASAIAVTNIGRIESLRLIYSANSDRTLYMVLISGAMLNRWWYNPRTGQATASGAVSNFATIQFTPPTKEDWVLVLDDSSRNYSAPGSQQL